MKEFCLSGEQEDERGRDKEADQGREAEGVHGVLLHSRTKGDVAWVACLGYYFIVERKGTWPGLEGWGKGSRVQKHCQEKGEHTGWSLWIE